MKIKLDRRFLFASLTVHILAIVLVAFFSSDGDIHKKFLVFGAHSKHITRAYFRPLKAPPTRVASRSYSAKATKDRGTGGKRLAQKKSSTQKKKTAASSAQAKKKTVAKKPMSKPKPKVEIQKEDKTEKVRKAELLQQKKKNEAKKKQEEAAKAKKQAEEKQRQEAEKAEQQVEEKKLREAQEKAKAPEQKLQESEEIDEPDEVKESDEEEILHFAMMGEQDPQFIKYHQCILHAINQVWKPPLGVPKGTECRVRIDIAPDGTVKKLEVVQKSHMLIYDLSIIRVKNELKVDNCLWGKTLHDVVFRQ